VTEQLYVLCRACSLMIEAPEAGDDRWRLCPDCLRNQQPIVMEVQLISNDPDRRDGPQSPA
jgi:hypothetical protein